MQQELQKMQEKVTEKTEQLLKCQVKQSLRMWIVAKYRRF